MKFVENRIDDLLPYMLNKSVLELGCVGLGDDDSYGGEHFIHKKVASVSNHCIGLDINKQGVKDLKGLGYNVKVQDIEKPFNLKESFDVILAEEVLEHLNNVGICMENIREHLKDNGVIIITTPNAQSISFFLQRLLRDEISGVSTTDHTHWHDISSIRTLLGRYGFEIEKYYYVHPLPINQTRKYKLIKFVFSFFPDRVGRNIVCIARKK